MKVFKEGLKFCESYEKTGMSELENSIYEFGPFRLVSTKRVLLRNVYLSAKAYRTR